MTRMVGGGGADYEEARDALHARHGHAQRGAAGPPQTTTEALHLINAVLAGLRENPDKDIGDPGHLGLVESSRSTQLLAALVVLRHLRAELASWEPQLIAAARDAGVSWAGLATALGVTSRQAAERRFLRLRPSVTGEPTGEGRVQAERAKRAGDRAVAQWARQNSAVLRQLAGQISALDDLSTSAQPHVARVQRALADDDPVTLLSPLADTRAHLVANHAALAKQITTIIGHIEQLRRDTRDRRAQPPNHDR